MNKYPGVFHAGLSELTLTGEKITPDAALTITHRFVMKLNNKKITAHLSYSVLTILNS